MPTVGPSDGGYKYYQQNISDLEDDLRNESKRARQHEKERVEELENRYQQVIRDHDDQLTDTLQRYKANADETIANERAYSKAEVDRIKAQTYDKFGRYNGEEADVVKAELKSTKEEADRQYLRDQKAMRDADEAYHARIADYSDDYERRLEKAVETARDGAAATYEQAAQEGRNQFNEYRDEAQKKNEDISQRHMQDMNEARRAYDRSTSAMKSEYERKIDRLSKTDNSRFEAADRAQQRKAEQDTRALADAHAAETANLREQVRDLQDQEKEYSRGRAQGAQEAVQEYEDGWRKQVARQQESYEDQIEDLKRKADGQEGYYSRQNTDNLREKDKYYTKVIQRQNQDHHDEKKRMERTFTADHEQMDLRAKKDREIAVETSERQLVDAAHQRDIALEDQAKAFQDTLSRENQAHREQTSLLEKELQYRRTSDDTNAISPAAEERVRKSVSGQYEKTAAAERTKNKATIDSIQREYADRLHDSILEHEGRERLMNQDFANERHQSEAVFLDHVADVEENKNATLRGKDLDNDRMTQNLMRNYSQMLSRQKAENEDTLVAQRNEASARITSQRQESEFNSRMAQRSFANRQNELIREYDKKLADQKQDYESRIDDLKMQHHQELREAERRTKQQLEEQQRSYDQRLAQTEAQHKERERYITQNYQDQLDKVTRSNALLVQKKS